MSVEEETREIDELFLTSIIKSERGADGFAKIFTRHLKKGFCVFVHLIDS